METMAAADMPMEAAAMETAAMNAQMMAARMCVCVSGPLNFRCFAAQDSRNQACGNLRESGTN